MTISYAIYWKRYFYIELYILKYFLPIFSKNIFLLLYDEIINITLPLNKNKKKKCTIISVIYLLLIDKLHSNFFSIHSNSQFLKGLSKSINGYFYILFDNFLITNKIHRLRLVYDFYFHSKFRLNFYT